MDDLPNKITKAIAAKLDRSDFGSSGDHGADSAIKIAARVAPHVVIKSFLDEIDGLLASGGHAPTLAALKLRLRAMAIESARSSMGDGQRNVFDVLCEHPKDAQEIAEDSGKSIKYAKVCAGQLSRMGFATLLGSKENPMWARTDMEYWA